MDFSTICRTCIKTINNTSLNPIFVSEDTHERFSSAIYLCTGIQVKLNDGLPQNMCTTCMNQFNSTMKFRKQCKQAETHLLKIKTELETESSTIVTTEQLSLNENDLKCSNITEMKSELNSIKNEPFEIDIGDIEPLKCLINKKKMPKTNHLKICNEENFESDYFNEEMVSYKNEKILKNSENITNTQDFKSKTQKNNDTKQKITEFTLSDNEDFNNDSNITESDSNITENKKNIEIPYIVTNKLTKKTTRVVCKLCQKELSIRSIDSHMMRRHPGADERKVKCELCDKYVMREKLNRHRIMMHGNVGVKCGYCKSEFKSKEVLVEHVTTCTAKNRKRKINDSGRALAECDICKMTMQRASLNKHTAVKHAGLRPVCEHCGKSFGNKFRLNEHYRAKHGYEKFQCSSCEFRSAGIMAMRNHERLHRGEKPFVCETCGAKFHAAYLLMQHKHSHKTEKLVKCDLCPASFKANNNLHMHKLTCHSKSYYSCALCARSYKCRYYAVKHVKLAHSVSHAPDVIKLLTQ